MGPAPKQAGVSGLWDVIIVGGGPAGLAAALVLGRACRRVVVCDDGRPRNRRARTMHGFPTRDGISPARMRALSRAEARRYDVTFIAQSVTDVRCVDGQVRVELESGKRLLGRRLLLATGVEDHVPEVPGLEALYGVSAHHCPYCDGWEWRDRRLAVYGRDRRGAELSHTLRTWSADVVLCTDGPVRLSASDRLGLAARGITLETRRITRLVGRGGLLRRIEFAHGDALERDALFLATGHRQRSPLATRLGCALTPKGAIRVGRTRSAHRAGIYAAGDAAGDEMHMVVVAAAEGAQAAVAISGELLAEDRAREIARARAGGTQLATGGRGNPMGSGNSRKKK